MKKILLISSCFLGSIFFSSCETPNRLSCCAAYHQDGCWKADTDTEEQCKELIDEGKGEYCECYCDKVTVDDE